MQRSSTLRTLPVAVFLFVRLSILLALPIDGLRGYGDFYHFFNLASLPGLPFLQYWAEFPPVFPFLSEIILALSGGQEHVYTYLLALLLLAADLGSLLLFIRLAARLDDQSSSWRPLIYAAALGGLAYAWWYFDSLAVFFTLLALELAFSRRSAVLSGLALGLGILTKLFPILLLPALWRWLPPRRAAWISAAAAGLVIAVYGGLWAASPAFTLASLQSQSAKGSWETVWALLDGNLQTGNFGAEIERLDPATAALPDRQSRAHLALGQPDPFRRSWPVLVGSLAPGPPALCARLRRAHLGDLPALVPRLEPAVGALLAPADPARPPTTPRTAPGRLSRSWSTCSNGR